MKVKQRVFMIFLFFQIPHICIWHKYCKTRLHWWILNTNQFDVVVKLQGCF